MKANTSTKIIFSLDNGIDILDMETATRMTREEADCIDLVDVGQAIVKVKGRIKQPIHVQFPYFEMDRNKISDAIIREEYKKQEIVQVDQAELDKIEQDYIDNILSKENRWQNTG